MVLLEERECMSRRYDVILSFRGDDTRKNFTDHLYTAFLNSSITVFLDDDETGEEELEEAIKASRASVVVFSQNYACSKWCLNKLVKILGQRRSSDHIVIPIFYHTDVTKQKKTLMAKHKQFSSWNEALEEIANLKGYDSANRLETKLIEEIVTDIYHRLRIPLKETSLPLLFGMESSIEFITSWLNDGSLHPADILTVSGMGGIGKTTLVKYVYQRNYRLFPKRSFLQGVNQICARNDNGIHDLRKQLCVDILEMIDHHKVFIVLDDIDNLKQLDALLGNTGFHPGSKIIITTKDGSLTQTFNTMTTKTKHTTLFLKGLDEQASLRLLSHHAFKRDDPKEGYEHVSAKVMAYCQGHPLALKVVGTSLHKRDVAEWEELVKGLKEETNSLIQQNLQMSFDALDKVDKELFKDIACFFVGEDKKFIETILKACDIYTKHGIRKLTARCLLTIGPKNKFKMHQLIREMGRDIVRQESPDRPWKRSRLWRHEDSFKVLKQNKGSRKLKGLTLDMKLLEKDKLCRSNVLKTDALSKMDNLMLLQLNHVRLKGSYKNFPRNLRWLCMHGFTLEYMPPDLQLGSLVVLDLSYSNLKSFDLCKYSNLSSGSLQELEKRKKLNELSFKTEGLFLLRSLKILNLSFSKQLRSIGGFFRFLSLEKLILASCIGLVEVCESIELCDKLVHIDLSYCSMLIKLPNTIFNLKKPKTIIIEGSSLGTTENQEGV